MNFSSLVELFNIHESGEARKYKRLLSGPPMRDAKARDAVLIFSVGAIIDFVWALFRGRSAFEAILCAFLGLFGTALYVFWRRIFDDSPPNTKSSKS